MSQPAMTTKHPLDVLGAVDSAAFRLATSERVPRHYRLDVDPPSPVASTSSLSASSSLSGHTPLRQRRGRHGGQDDSSALRMQTFTGRCSITFEVVNPVASERAATFLLLHALDLTFSTEDVAVEVLPRESASSVSPAASPRLPGSPATDSPLPLIPCLSHVHWSASETVSFEFAAPLPNERGDCFCLHFRRYTGQIYSESQGIYRSRPEDPLFLTTHLEPTNARRVFPCFDEPAFLAVFELSVVTAPGYTAVSNTPFVRAEFVPADNGAETGAVGGDEVMAATQLSAGGGNTSGRVSPSSSSSSWRRAGTANVAAGSGPAQTTTVSVANNSIGGSATVYPTTPLSGNSCEADRATTPLRAFVVREESITRRRCFFEPTPRLHTCIIAFSIGRYVIAERFSRRRGIACRVVVPEADPLHSAWFALDILIKAIDFFDTFFDFELPLRKIDLVALDHFGALGMENWGMIVLAKTHMLVSERTPLERRQRITRLIGHEVCHQWFGDWATVAWWNDLWLKEGVCRYLEYFFVDSVSPSWCVWNEFVGSIVEDAIMADADLAHTHPVRYCLDAPRSIGDSFDYISYGKGAAILRMLFSNLTSDQLRRSFHLVLVRHGGATFDLEAFQSCVEDAVRSAGQPNRKTTSRRSQGLGRSPVAAAAAVAEADTHSLEGSDSEEDQEAVLISMVRQVLSQVNMCGHPYLLVRDVGCHGEGATVVPESAETIPTTTYTVTQYRTTLTTGETLAAYVHHRQRQRGPIDLLTPPVDEFFGWDPNKVLPPAEPVTCVPVRVMEIHCRLGLCLPPRLVSLTGATTVCEQPHLSRALTSPFTFALGEQPGPPAPAEGSASAAAMSAVAMAAVMSPASATSTGAFLSYFNADGAAMMTCDYDSNTWRRLIEAAPYLTDEDRMSLTSTLARLRPMHIGHLDGESSSTDRCTLFLEWTLAISQSPRLMTSFLWDKITARLETLLFLTQNNYCNLALCELAENVLAPLHQRCLLSFFAREKSTVDGFESRVHVTFQSVMQMLFVLALCHKPDYRDEAQEIRHWTFQDLFESENGEQAASSNTSSTGMDNSFTNVARNSYESTGNNPSAGPPMFADSQHSPLGMSGTSSTGCAPTTPPLTSAMCSTAPTVTESGAAMASLLLSTNRNAGLGLSTRPSTDGIFFSSSVNTHQRATAVSALLSPMPSNSAGPSQPPMSSGAGGSGQPPMLASRGHWIGDTSVNLERPSHVSVIQTALFYLIEMGDLPSWLDVAAVVAHRLRMDVGVLEEALGLPVPRLSTAIEHGLRERRTELLVDLSNVLIPILFALDDERAFPFMADVFNCFSMLGDLAVRLIFRNTRFLTHLLTNRLVEEPLLSRMLEVGARVCSNGTIIALLKINLTSIYGDSSSAGSGRPRPEKASRTVGSDAAPPLSHPPGASGLEAMPARCDALLDPAMAREIHECRQLEFCGPVDDKGDEEDEDANNSAGDGNHDTTSTAAPGSDRRDGESCEEAVHTPHKTTAGHRSGSVGADHVFAVRPAAAAARAAYRRHRHLPDRVVKRLDAMEANCVWADYCCEHFERFVRDARVRYPFWSTTAISIAPSSCLTPLTAEPSGRDGRGDAERGNFGGVSI